ncbi:MAG TPA: winged helix-turn-helix transcriptional regulator, partial [Patescibacteria group bacterium]|nr:winged helix-turn-helix transcriptional regulator [Patescibacteria group bacterium]
SLDNIKKGIRLKFKELTEQEFLVFSAIYQMDSEKGFSDYRSIAQKLGLSESSVRDYVGKLIKKEIPVDKIKINNKNIRISVSEKLKKIVSLNTIFQLRGI